MIIHSINSQLYRNIILYLHGDFLFTKDDFFSYAFKIYTKKEEKN